MAMRVQILDKIQRNCQQRGLSVSRPSADLLVAEGMDISVEEAAITAPMGGIDPTVSPFLGIGVANPGVIVVEKEDLEMSAAELRVLRIASGHANDISIRTDAADATTELARLEGHADLNGMGQ